MHAGQGPVGPVDHGPPEPPETSPGSPQEPRTPWQNIGRAKLKRLAKYQQIPSGFGNSTGDVNFSAGLRPASGWPPAGLRPASGWPPAGLRPASGRRPAESWSLAPGTSPIRTVFEILANTPRYHQNQIVFDFRSGENVKIATQSPTGFRDFS